MSQYKSESVVFFNFSLAGGGAERVFVTLANGLAERGWDVTALSLHGHGDQFNTLLSHKVKRKVLECKYSRTCLVTLGWWIFNNKPSRFLVFNTQLTIVLLFLKKALFLDYKIVARCISTLSCAYSLPRSPWRKFVDWIIRSLYRHADIVIAQSRGMADDLLYNFKLDPPKVRIINNPVAPQFVEIGSLLRNGSEKYVAPTILAVGRLVPAKGYDLLLKAFAIVTRSIPNSKLLLVGQGPLENELKSLAQKLSIESMVHFEGFQSDVACYYSKSHLLVSTSLWEGFPNVFLESLVMGLPIVSRFYNSGPAEIIQDGVNGFLVKGRDVEIFAAKIIDALFYDWDHELIKNSGKCYYPSKIVDSYEAVFLESC